MKQDTDPLRQKEADVCCISFTLHATSEMFGMTKVCFAFVQISKTQMQILTAVQSHYIVYAWFIITKPLKQSFHVYQI